LARGRKTTGVEIDDKVETGSAFKTIGYKKDDLKEFKERERERDDVRLSTNTTGSDVEKR
jgi:hypothetical protein